MPSFGGENPEVCVAFGIELGEYARENGIVYDVNYGLLRESLMAGGLSNDAITKYPTIIKATNDPESGGRCYWLNPDDPGDEVGPTRLELYTYHGTGRVSTRSATHEAKHLADRLTLGGNGFVSERAKKLRKAGIAVGAAALAGAVIYGQVRLLNTPRVNVFEKGLWDGAGLAETDITLSGLLMAEYAVRKQERRARRAARRVERNNLLLLGSQNSPTEATGAEQLKSAVKAVFMPNFGH